MYESIKINDLEPYLSSCIEDESEDNQLTQQFEVLFYQLHSMNLQDIICCR
jgi:hypothetical protein